MMLDVTDKVLENDRNRLVELLKEAKQILNKYPFIGRNYTCDRDRAKFSVFEAYEWCSYLESVH